MLMHIYFLQPAVVSGQKVDAAKCSRGVIEMKRRTKLGRVLILFIYFFFFGYKLGKPATLTVG